MRWTDDSYAFAVELLEKAGMGVVPGVAFGLCGKRAVRFSYEYWVVRGFTAGGRFLLVVLDYLADEDIVIPVTAFEPEEI